MPRREPWHEYWGPGVSLLSSRPLFWEERLAEGGRVLSGSPGVLRSWVFGLLDLALTGVVAGGRREKERIWKTPHPGRIQFLRLGLNSPLCPHPLFCPTLSQKQIIHTSLNSPKLTIYVHYCFLRVFCVLRIVIYYHNDPMKEVLLSSTSSWRKKPTQRREGRSSQYLNTPS